MPASSTTIDDDIADAILSAFEHDSSKGSAGAGPADAAARPEPQPDASPLVVTETASPGGHPAPERVEEPRRGQAITSLPKSVPGGFAGLASDLDRQGREKALMVRLLAQQGLVLEASEGERRRLNEELDRVVVAVRESSLALKVALASAKAGDISSNISRIFADVLIANHELEGVSTALTANALLLRTSWEQYARSALSAFKMRDEGN